MKQRIRKIGDPERNPVYTTRSFPFPIVGLQIGRAGASYCMPRNIINNFQVISAEVERGGAGSRSNGPRRRSVHRGNHEAGMDGEGWTRKTGREGNKGEEEQRARCLRQFSDRDWLHPTLPTERGQTVPLLPYYILHNSNSERSELLRCSSWGWMKEKRRKEAVRFTGRRARRGSMRLGWKEKRNIHHSRFTPFIIDATLMGLREN